MTDDKVVTLFGRGIPAGAHLPTDRDLFGSLQEVRGKVVFLDEADWHEDSLLRVMARNPVAMVVDMRSRPVFRLPHYRHRYIVSYFYRNGIQYLELISLLRERSVGENKNCLGLADVVFGRAEHGLTIFLYDVATKERGWLNSIRALMKSKTNQFVELHPRALAGWGLPDRGGR